MLVSHNSGSFNTYSSIKEDNTTILENVCHFGKAKPGGK